MYRYIYNIYQLQIFHKKFFSAALLYETVIFYIFLLVLGIFINFPNKFNLKIENTSVFKVCTLITYTSTCRNKIMFSVRIISTYDLYEIFLKLKFSELT